MRAELVHSVAERIAAFRTSHPTRVAIDGVDAAGKTRLADELVAPLSSLGKSVIRASIDGFHRRKDQRYRRGQLSAEGYYLDSFDYEALRSQLLQPLGPDGNRWYRRAVFDYRRDAERAEPLEIARADAVLLFDGIFLLRPEINDYWDARIFVSVPVALALERGVARDRGHEESEHGVQTRYEQRYLPAQQLYLASVRPERLANIVIDNSDPAMPRIVTEPE